MSGPRSALGTIAGSLIALRWRPRYPMRMAMLLTLPWPSAIAAYAAGAPLPAMLAAMVIGGAAWRCSTSGG